MRSPARILVLAALAVSSAACSGTTLNTSGLPSLAGYQNWYHIAVTNQAAGHSDAYRIIYVNPTGRMPPRQGFPMYYKANTFIVNEIHLRTSSGPGPLQSVAIMRKLAPADAPPGAQLEGENREVRGSEVPGWLFTTASKVGAPETQRPTCYSSCHVQAPYDNTWLNYLAMPGTGAPVDAM